MKVHELIETLQSGDQESEVRVVVLNLQESFAIGPVNEGDGEFAFIVVGELPE